MKYSDIRIEKSHLEFIVIGEKPSSILFFFPDFNHFILYWGIAD